MSEDLPEDPDAGGPTGPAAADEPDQDVAEDLAAVLASLLDDLCFAELGEALRSVAALRGAQRRRVLATCRAGARLLTLDAADFADVDGIPADLRAEVRRMQFPKEPLGEPRGSLDSLVPLVSLMVESLDVHWQRDHTAYVVLILHLLGEYLPLLAWEPVIGHAGDPLRLRRQTEGTLWATDDCAMPRQRRSAAERVVAMDPDSSGGGVHPEQWQAYLDRWHSRVSAALQQCALRPGDGRPNPDDAGCDKACAMVTRLDDGVLGDLAARMALAKVFSESPVVALRHSAPVGHFFGVPDRDEVRQAWEETVQRLCREWGGQGPWGGNPVGGGLSESPGEPLPGLVALLSAVAGREVRSATVLHRVADDIRTVLEELADSS